MSAPAPEPATAPHPKTVEEITARNVRAIGELERGAQKTLSWGDRLAMQINRVCGSMPFLWSNAIGFALWMSMNTVFLSKPWDPFPYNFLTLVVSLEAIFLSIFLLIASNRQAQVAERRNQLDLQINLLSEQEGTKTLQLLHLIAEKLGVKEDDDPTLEVLKQATNPEILVSQITEIEKETEEAGSSGRSEE